MMRSCVLLSNAALTTLDWCLCLIEAVLQTTMLSLNLSALMLIAHGMWESLSFSEIHSHLNLKEQAEMLKSVDSSWEELLWQWL